MLNTQRAMEERLAVAEHRVRLTEENTAAIDAEKRKIDYERRRMELDLAEAESALMRLQKDDAEHNEGAASSTLALKEEAMPGKTHKQKEGERRRAMQKHKQDRRCDVVMFCYTCYIITEIVVLGLLSKDTPSTRSRRLLSWDCCRQTRPRHAPSSSSSTTSVRFYFSTIVIPFD